jgi:alpha-tubulin suppressor-like RCC1 family protein
MNAKTGEVYCWGQSTNSNLGTGMETDNAIPHKVYGINDAAKIDTGDAFACALRQSGFISCWGKNDVGQVGDGIKDSADRIFPSYVAIVRNAVDLSIGDKHACALIDDGKVMCWGSDKYGQLGDISLPTSNLVQTSPNSILAVTIPLPEPIASITTGSNHTCALSKTGFVYCWGSNLVGQLGLGLQNISVSKPKIVPGLSNVVSVKSHYDSTCAKTSTAGLYCWGKGTEGQLGESEWFNRYLPRLMSGTYSITNTSTNVATSYTYATSLSNFAFGTNGGCGIDNKSGYGYLVCWGGNTGKEPTSLQAVDVVLGKNHGCIITITSTVACWGSNLYGQTGANTVSPTSQTVAVLKGIPEWRNYITSWGISYSNNVATISWTGAAENKFALYVEPFGYVCEAAALFNCQVGVLESNKTYNALLVARGLTNANTRSATFSFTTGEIKSAYETYTEAAAAEAKKALDAKNAANKAAQEEQTTIANTEAFKNICENNLDSLAIEISNYVNVLATRHEETLVLLNAATGKLSGKLSPKALAIIKSNKLDIQNSLSELWSSTDLFTDFECFGDIQEDTTGVYGLETEVRTSIRDLNAIITKSINQWKSALLLRK